MESLLGFFAKGFMELFLYPSQLRGADSSPVLGEVPQAEG